MFSIVDPFLMFDPGSGRRGALLIQTREPIRSIRAAKNFAKLP